MAKKPIEYSAFSADGGPVVEFAEPSDETEIEDFEEAKAKGPTERWTFWQAEIQASLAAEKRFREEAREAEISYFGNEDQAYTTADYKKREHQTNIIHANIETLRPLVYSDTPSPIVRRRFTGDGENDPTDRVAAVVVQRLGEYLVHTSGFEEAMELARDDWLIPGRGSVRVLYNADFKTEEVIDPTTGRPVIDGDSGSPFKMRVKRNEKIHVRHWPYRRILYSANNTWDECRWVGFETPLTKAGVVKRFGQEKADATTYPINGLRGGKHDDSAKEMAGLEPESAKEESGAQSVSTHDQCVVMEIWDKENRKVIWWSPHFRDDILDESDDVLGLEGFWNTPKPLTAITLAGSLTPRPEIAYYRARAEEVDIATSKLRKILDAVSLSGAYPGAMVEEIKQLLDGKTNKLVAIENWMGFLEKGGGQGVIQWLPLDMFMKTAQALVQLRDQAKYALYEISGISDIVRGQGDPNETATAQQIKGNYANLRLRDKQAKMHRFALDTIKIMIEIAVEHFDIATIAAITNMDLAQTDGHLAQITEAHQAMQAQYEQAVMAAQQQGATPPPEPPAMPFLEQTSWERVHATIRNDMSRKFAISIETDGTILADTEADKSARIEFLQTFAAMSEQLFPLAKAGIIEMKVIKEVMLFAVRGFPMARTLEGMLASLPDKLDQGEPEVDPSITVAKINAEVKMAIAKMQAEGDADSQEKNQAHDLRKKGAEILADGFLERLRQNNSEPPDLPVPQQAPTQQ